MVTNVTDNGSTCGNVLRDLLDVLNFVTRLCCHVVTTLCVRVETV
jgi:hypothetical protein